MSKEYKKGDVLTVKIEKIVPRGLGISFTDGLTVFTYLAAIGDMVKVRLSEVKGRTAFAEVEEVLEASPDRIEPPCGYFGACGGCDFQHLNYDAQLRAKVAMITDCIERIGKIQLTEAIKVIASPQEFDYRLRAQWHVNTRSKKIGFYRRNTRDLISIESCPVMMPELNQELDRLRHELDWNTFFEEKTQIDAACGNDGKLSVFSPELIEPTNDISFKAAGESFTFNARSFFQGNRYLVDALVDAAISETAGETALDLYCGVGLFSLPLARRFKQVIGVEENEAAIAYANANAEAAGLTNTTFYAAGVRRFLHSGEVKNADLVLLDPPRAGTEKDTIQNVIALRPAEISYVACEPSVLARDLKRFVERDYRIDSITAIDLFPQTHHVETVVRLTLN